MGITKVEMTIVGDIIRTGVNLDPGVNGNTGAFIVMVMVMGYTIATKRGKARIEGVTSLTKQGM